DPFGDGRLGAEGERTTRVATARRDGDLERVAGLRRNVDRGAGDPAVGVERAPVGTQEYEVARGPAARGRPSEVEELRTPNNDQRIRVLRDPERDRKEPKQGRAPAPAPD